MERSRQRTVVITGASAGIGRALAFEFARRGCHLGLVARRRASLEALRAQIRSLPECRGLRVELATIDVTQQDKVAEGMRALFDALAGADVVIANAGANDLTEVGQGQLDRQLSLIRTNLVGAIATADAAVAHFVGRGGGHLVGISSLASLQPLARQAAYCASKAGFSMYLKAARVDLQSQGIVVTDILPGYVSTDIVDGVDISELPFAVSPEFAANEIADLVDRRVTSGVVPAFPWKFLRPLLGHIPQRFLT
jgi:short-subunit dehydrogenase